MTQEQLMFASLVGSKLLRIVPKIEILENEMNKHVLPVIPLLPFENASSVFDNVHNDPLTKEAQFFPLSLSIDSGKTWFLLPWEPLISVTGKNNIVRRNIAKYNPDYSKIQKGSIKERWSQDDYSITITGMLFGKNMMGKFEDTYPKEDFEKLRKVLTHSKQIMVTCPLFELLNIHYIAIEEFTFPFTKGENVQAYEIKAYSDDGYSLLIEENK